MALAKKDEQIAKMTDSDLQAAIKALAETRMDLHNKGELNYLAEGTQDRYARLILKVEGRFREEALFRGYMYDDYGNTTKQAASTKKR
jgi:tetrahydromethanopterin S-methyltransferase subunit H